MRDDDGSMEEFARITTPFVKDKIERRFRMSKEEKHLQTKIRIFEDMLLRCKNFGQAEAIQIELTRMRAKLQKFIGFLVSLFFRRKNRYSGKSLDSSFGLKHLE